MKTCMNIQCGTTSCKDWKTGWCLRSGELAYLCDKCGYAFEQRVYCEEFHADDSGWRECVTCAKRLHCGCIASLSLIELLDGGGVKCIGCARSSDFYSILQGRKCTGSGPCTVIENNSGIGDYKQNNGIDELPLMSLLKQGAARFRPMEAGTTWIPNLAQTPMECFQKARLDISSSNLKARNDSKSVAHPNLSITLGGSTGSLQPTSGAAVDEREENKMSNALNQGFLSSNLLSTPTKLSFSPASDTNAIMTPQIRVARPPIEGRGRNQLLPRYWPRITDQELQQISGDPNCTIVPLFEKVLSASDAGKIGRLVLPKACAEAYFPAISQAEGLPIRIEDIKGKEWVFQFRFWPNNNSRMYVLEGVTACLQSLQLEAGDTVTFSRKDPEGKLVMGFRKASVPASTQDAALLANRNAPVPSESFLSGVIDNLPVLSGCPGLLQPMKGSITTPMNGLSRHLDSAAGSNMLHNTEKCGERTEEGMLPPSMPIMERKKGRNIGSKNKRLLIDSQDALALRLTWEEVQGMLRPPQSAKPSVVVIEDCEFEEYEEPPVLGKNSIFTARSSGVVEQWAQCDNCSKWRRLPANILLPSKWTCGDNAWDQTRCFCSAPDELGPKELENLLSLRKDTRKRRMVMANGTIQEQDSSGLNALATAVVPGDNTSEPGTSSAAATTRHPRHRPGCSCIVCIQPPSGKGKHNSTCTCTVCLTVRRRFKTLMMRKKKRQSDQEAELALKNQQKENHDKEDDKAEVRKKKSHHEGVNDSQVGLAHVKYDQGMNPVGALADSGKGLDLNCHPLRENSLRMGSDQATNLLQLASHPLEVYKKQNGHVNLMPEQQASATTHLGQATEENKGQHIEDHPVCRAPHSNGSCEFDNNKQHSNPL